MCSVWCVFYVIYLSGLAVVAVVNPAVPVQLTAGFDSVCNFHFKKKEKKKKPVCFAFNLRKVQLAANQGAA